MFPASMRVLMDREPNLLMMGPGESPVFPELIVMSSRAVSPVLAKTFTLFLWRLLARVKGFPFEKM